MLIRTKQSELLITGRVLREVAGVGIIVLLIAGALWFVAIAFFLELKECQSSLSSQRTAMACENLEKIKAAFIDD